MIYIAFISVELFVPDWTEENKAEAEANLAKDIYYNDDEEVGFSCFSVVSRIWTIAETLDKFEDATVQCTYQNRRLKTSNFDLTCCEMRKRTLEGLSSWTTYPWTRPR